MNAMRLDDLTEAELIALTPEHVQLLIDRMCAAEGIPLPPPIPVAPTKLALVPEITTYDVYGQHFVRQEDALKMLELVQSLERYTVDYVYGRGDYTYYVKGIAARDSTTVSVSHFMSAQQKDDTERARAQYSEAEKAYEAASKEYKQATEARAGIVEQVTTAIGAAVHNQRRREECRANFARYLQIANDDRIAAYRFYQNAYAQTLVAFPELVTEFSPE